MHDEAWIHGATTSINKPSNWDIQILNCKRCQLDIQDQFVIISNIVRIVPYNSAESWHAATTGPKWQMDLRTQRLFYRLQAGPLNHEIVCYVTLVFSFYTTNNAVLIKVKATIPLSTGTIAITFIRWGRAYCVTHCHFLYGEVSMKHCSQCSQQEIHLPKLG